METKKTDKMRGLASEAGLLKKKLDAYIAGNRALGGAYARVKLFLSDRNNRKKVIYALIAVAVIILIKDIFFRKPAHVIAPKPVQTAPVTVKDAPVYIESFGSLVPPDDVNIKSQVEGEIKEIHFRDGQDVKKLDPLFTIDPSPFKAQLDKAQAQIVQDQAELNLKKTTLERNKQLLKDQLISQQQYDQYQTDVDSATAKLMLDRASEEIARINLGYCSITSPIDGRAGKCMVDPGNIVPANTGPTLVNIKTINPIYLDFTIPERDLPRVRQAMSEGNLKVEFTVEGDDANTYQGNIIFLDNKVDNSTGAFMLRASVDNNEYKLWPGQFANIHLILSVQKNACLAPYQAVQMGQDGQYVFVVQPDDKVEIRTVATGNRQGDDIVITNGVAEGQRLVTVGQLGLSPGAKVEDLSAEKAKK